MLFFLTGRFTWFSFRFKCADTAEVSLIYYYPVATSIGLENVTDKAGRFEGGRVVSAVPSEAVTAYGNNLILIRDIGRDGRFIAASFQGGTASGIDRDFGS